MANFAVTISSSTTRIIYEYDQSAEKTKFSSALIDAMHKCATDYYIDVSEFQIFTIKLGN